MSGVGPTGDARGTSTESGPDQSNTPQTQAPDTTQAVFTELCSPSSVRSLETLADAKELAEDLLTYEEHVEVARSVGMLADVTPEGSGPAEQYGSVFQSLKGVDLRGKDASGIKILHNGQVRSLGDVILSFDIDNEAGKNALKTLLQGTVYDEHTRFIAAEPDETDRNVDILARLEKVSSSYSNNGSELHNLSGILKFAKDGFVWAVPASAATGPSVEVTGESHPRQITAPSTNEPNAAQDPGAATEPSASIGEAEVHQIQIHDSEPDEENGPTTEESPLKRLASLYRSSIGDGSDELSDDAQVLEHLTREGKAAEWFRRMTAKQRVEALDILVAVAGEDNSPEEKSAHSKHVGVTGMTAVWLDLMDAHVDLQNRASSASRGGNESEPAENSASAQAEPMSGESNPKTNQAQEGPDASLSIEHPGVDVRLRYNYTTLTQTEDKKGELLNGPVGLDIEIVYSATQAAIPPIQRFERDFPFLFGALLSQFDKEIVPQIVSRSGERPLPPQNGPLSFRSQVNFDGQCRVAKTDRGFTVNFNRRLNVASECNRVISEGESVLANVNIAVLLASETLIQIGRHLSGNPEYNFRWNYNIQREADGSYTMDFDQSNQSTGSGQGPFVRDVKNIGETARRGSASGDAGSTTGNVGSVEQLTTKTEGSNGAQISQDDSPIQRSSAEVALASAYNEAFATGGRMPSTFGSDGELKMVFPVDVTKEAENDLFRGFADPEGTQLSKARNGSYSVFEAGGEKFLVPSFLTMKGYPLTPAGKGIFEIERVAGLSRPELVKPAVLTPDINGAELWRVSQKGKIKIPD